MEKRRVMVTGIGVVSPLGVGVEAYWQALAAGQNAVARIASFDPSRFDSQLAGEIKTLKIQDYVPKAYRTAYSIPQIISGKVMLYNPDKMAAPAGFIDMW